MMVDKTSPNTDEYLGDNIYINNILKQMSTNLPDDINSDDNDESSRFDKDYEIIDIIGKTGSFEGNCYKCLNKLDRIVYFAKEIKLEYETI
jgi:hypothetical protein